jgi:sirohydrochlorin ferrochelatase
MRALVASGAAQVVVAPYLLADGAMADRAADAARTAGRELGVEVIVAAVIGAAPELVDLVLTRAGAAAS